MNNIYATKESQKLNNFSKFVELVGEVQELGGAITRKDKNNIGEEIMDVMQWCINIAESYNLNINELILKHQGKLLERGYEFVLFK